MSNKIILRDENKIARLWKKMDEYLTIVWIDKILLYIFQTEKFTFLDCLNLRVNENFRLETSIRSRNSDSIYVTMAICDTIRLFKIDLRLPQKITKVQVKMKFK